MDDHDTEKTRATIVRRQQNELLLVKARDEVILKPLVEAQATFVAVTLRQIILAFPLKTARKMVRLPDEKAAKRILDKVAHDLCKELASFPAKIGQSSVGSNQKARPEHRVERRTQTWTQQTLG
jgi:hypothetical protein